MKKKLGSSKNIITSIILLVTILSIFGFWVIYSSYQNILVLGRLDKHITLSEDISRTIHSIQKERGYSSGYVFSEKFKENLKK